nr:universal stress protein [Chloroflexota bacterium]
MKFLICIDGSPPALEAARQGAALAAAAGAQVTRLRVARQPRETAPDASIRLRVGEPVEQILAEVSEGAHDLVVIGTSGGRGLAKLFMGSTSSRLAKRSPVPLLVVKGRRESVKRILVCTGGEMFGEQNARWGGQVAAWTGARVTILHVMSQMPLSERARLEDLDDTAPEAIAQNTREGAMLQSAVDAAVAVGAAAEVKPKLRHGLVLDEILAEIEAGDYDLVVIGAHYAPPGMPWRGLLLDDVADQIIEQSPRSVLVVRPVS